MSGMKYPTFSLRRIQVFLLNVGIVKRTINRGNVAAGQAPRETTLTSYDSTRHEAYVKEKQPVATINATRQSDMNFFMIRGIIDKIMVYTTKDIVYIYRQKSIDILSLELLYSLIFDAS